MLKSHFFCTFAQKQRFNSMIIDFQQQEEVQITGFKGGSGELLMRSYVDEKNRMMLTTVKPGASSGLHSHDQNSELIYVLKGTLTFHCDDIVEQARAGQVHYCPMGHSHYMVNETDDDVVYFAIVAEHH